MLLASLIISGLVLVWTIVSFFLLHNQNMKIQELQAQLNKKNELSKIQFETEFGLFRELSSKLIKLQQDMFLLYPRGLVNVPSDPEVLRKYKENNYKKAAHSYDKFNSSLAGYAPFINESFYKKLDEIRKKVQYQLNWYPEFNFYDLDSEIQKEYRDEKRKCSKLTDEINQSREEFISELREYFKEIVE